jgi:hypothetical protein
MGDGGTKTFSPLPAYEVVNETTGAVVASGTAIDMGDDTGFAVKNSGEHVYRLSLNAVPIGGPYFVSVLGAGRSRSFGVGDVYSAQIANVTARIAGSATRAPRESTFSRRATCCWKKIFFSATTSKKSPATTLRP